MDVLFLGSIPMYHVSQYQRFLLHKSSYLALDLVDFIESIKATTQNIQIK